MVSSPPLITPSAIIHRLPVGGGDKGVTKMKEVKDMLRIVGIILLGMFVVVVGIPVVLTAAGIVLSGIGAIISIAVALIKLGVLVAVGYLVLVGIRAVLR